MATWYADSTAAPGGDGSADSPFDALSDLTAVVSSGDTVRLIGGSVFRESMPSLPVDDLTVAGYGTGERPRIVGADVVSSWTAVGGGVYSNVIGSNVVGNVTEDGEPLNWKGWNTDLATTALLAGSFTFDYNTGTVYIFPSSGAPSSHVYEVSVRTDGWLSTSSLSGLVVADLEIRQFSRHGVNFRQRSDIAISGVDLFLIGGIRDTSSNLWLGNGIELAHGTNRSRVRDCSIRSIFDAGGTSQAYNSTTDSLTDHSWDRINIDICGQSGIEVSCQSANQTVSNIRIRRVTVRRNGSLGWLQYRTGNIPYGIGCYNAKDENSVIDRVLVDLCDIETQRWATQNVSTRATGTAENGATNFVVSRTRMVGPGANTTAPTSAGVRLGGGNVEFAGNIVSNFSYGIDVVGSNTITINASNNVFDGNTRATWRNNPNASFVCKSNLYLNQTAFVHAGNYAGGFSGEGNALWNNAANGGSYSSSGDVTSDPMVTSDYVPLPGSPLLPDEEGNGGGADLGYIRDIRGFQSRKHIGAYGAARIKT